jgi:hypothetical protein
MDLPEILAMSERLDSRGSGSGSGSGELIGESCVTMSARNPETILRPGSKCCFHLIPSERRDDNESNMPSGHGGLGARLPVRLSPLFGAAGNPSAIWQLIRLPDPV